MLHLFSSHGVHLQDEIFLPEEWMLLLHDGLPMTGDYIIQSYCIISLFVAENDILLPWAAVNLFKQP